MKNFECKNILLLTPVYNDWKSFEQLLEDLDELALNDKNISVLAVNDCSSDKLKNVFECKQILSIEIINLTINLGHQRAIAVGLSSIDLNLYDAVIVMDSDGEDRIEDLTKLINSYQETGSIVVAKRKNRSESFLFKIFYFLYKVLFKLLTGKSIHFGNFSIFSTSIVNQLITSRNIWNNFPSTLLSLKLPIFSIDTDRGKRYFGSSKMNMSSLILHGLSAISVFLDFVLIRLIFGFIFLFSLILFLIINSSVVLMPFPELNINFLFIILNSVFILLVFLIVRLLVYLNYRSRDSRKLNSFYKDFISSREIIFKKN